MYAPTCGGTHPGTRGNAMACRNLLIASGSAYCDVPGGGTGAVVLCTAGDTEIVGWNYYGLQGGVVADCADVAIGAAWVVDNCGGCFGKGSEGCSIEG